MIHRKLRALCERLLILPALILCIGSPGAFAATIGGETYYVSGSGDDASGDGSETNPWRTITHAAGMADSGACSIMVGEGTYNEEAGESFPVQLGANSVNFIGPGDGSALVQAGTNVFEAYDSLAQYEISGLDFEGMVTGGLMPGPPAVFVTTDTEIPPFLKIDNNNVSNMGLAVLDGSELGVFLVPASVVEITNNTVANADLGVEVDLGISMSAFEDTTCLLDFKIEGNQFVGCDTAVELDFYVWNPLEMKVAITNNQFSSCVHGVDSSLNARALTVDVELLINDNVFNEVEYALSLSCSAEEHWSDSEQTVLSRDIQILGNEIQAGSAIYFTTSVSEGPVVEQSILIAENTIIASSEGIYQSFEVSDNSADLRIDREVSILNNTIEAGSGNAVFLYQEYSSEERGVCDYDLTVDGNTIRGKGGYGLCLSHYLSYTATSVIKHTITRNHISESESNGVWIEVNGSTGMVDHNVLVRGNVFEDNGSSEDGYGQAHVAAEADIGSDATYDLSFDMGVASAFGYNTIVADDTNPSQWSVWFYFPTQSSINADLSVVGNWWGTQESSLVEDRAYHGFDESSLFTANLSNPLPDSLNFTAEYVEGVGIVATAGEDAGFVAYAGDLIMTGSLTGPFGSDGGDVEASWVSEDYQTLTLPEGEEDEFSPPPGTYELCLTNPGGQTGCATFTVEAGEEDCSQNQIPTAVSDIAETSDGAAIVIDLTANDSDFNGNMDPTAVTITQTPEKGSLVNNGDGTVTYTPGEGTVQTGDSFNYTVGDTCGAISNVASCQVLMDGGPDNHMPDAIYDAGVTTMGVPVTIDLLVNDSDPDGDTLNPASVMLTQSPHKGSVTLNGDGTATYKPNGGVAGTTDTFNYTVDDEHGLSSNIATVSVTINFDMDKKKLPGGASGGIGRVPAPGDRSGGLGNTGTVGYGSRTP